MGITGGDNRDPIDPMGIARMAKNNVLNKQVMINYLYVHIQSWQIVN